MKDLTRDPSADWHVFLDDGEVWLDTPHRDRLGCCIGTGDSDVEAIDDGRRELRARLADLDRAYRALAEGEATR